MSSNSVDSTCSDTRNRYLQAMMPRVVKLELILTESCNLGCSYCFEYKANHKNSMPLEVAFKAIDFLIEASRNSNWIGISFIGGEPVLKIDLIKEIVSYARQAAESVEKSISFDMQTNGVLLREEHAQYLSENNIRYCLSLDGSELSNDQHRKTLGGGGTFQIVAAKMRMLKKYQHWQGARMTIMPENAIFLGENIKSLHEQLKINQFIIGFATHVEWNDSQVASYATGLQNTFDYFLHQRVNQKSRRIRISLFELGQLTEAYLDSKKNSWGCGAGSGRLAVSPDGVFHGCSKLAWSPEGGTANPPLPLGSVKRGFDKPENRLKLLDHTETNRTKCQSCELKAHCNGGCYAANFADTGTMYEPADYYCKLVFAQKYASEYARERIDALGLDDLYWSSNIPNLENLREPSGNIYGVTS